MAITDRSKTNSSRKSRSLETSRLFRATASKPSFCRTDSRSIGSDVPGQGRGPERQHVDALAAVGEPLAVALELLDVGEEIMRRQHRLGALEVRVAGQNDAGLALGRCYEGPLQVGEKAVEFVDRVANPELHVGDDLIVAAAAGVQLAAHVAELRDEGTLDVRVDVFQCDGELHLPGLDLGADLVEGRRICSASAAASSPTSASIRAWAWLARMSWRNRRRSKLIDSVNASTRASVPPSNRPPHVFWLMAWPAEFGFAPGIPRL